MTCLHNHDQILEYQGKIFFEGFQNYQNYLCALILNKIQPWQKLSGKYCKCQLNTKCDRYWSYDANHRLCIKWVGLSKYLYDLQFWFLLRGIANVFYLLSPSSPLQKQQKERERERERGKTTNKSNKKDIYCLLIFLSLLDFLRLELFCQIFSPLRRKLCQAGRAFRQDVRWLPLQWHSLLEMSRVDRGHYS